MKQFTNNHYPRGLPFQAPPIRATSQKWWQHKLVVVAAALALTGCVAAVVYTVSRPAAPVPADKTSRTANERSLEALGSLSASHLYQSYLNIGMLADAVENESYTKAHAQEMLATVVNLMNAVDRNLQRLAEADLPADDGRDVERIRGLSVLLRVQVVALQSYWASGEPRQAARYHEARERAWRALSELLRL